MYCDTSRSSEPSTASQDPLHNNRRHCSSNQANTDALLVSYHGRCRIGARRISINAVIAALTHGRTVYVRGAKIHAIGRKEVRRLSQHNLDLSQYEGIQVVCAPDGTILTAYRNHDFRGLRPRRRHRHRNRRNLRSVSTSEWLDTSENTRRFP